MLETRRQKSSGTRGSAKTADGAAKEAAAAVFVVATDADNEDEASLSSWHVVEAERHGWAEHFVFVVQRVGVFVVFVAFQ